MVAPIMNICLDYNDDGFCRNYLGMGRINKANREATCEVCGLKKADRDIFGDAPCRWMFDTEIPVPDRPCKGNRIICKCKEGPIYNLENIKSTCDCKPGKCNFFDNGLPHVLFLTRWNRPEYRTNFRREVIDALTNRYNVHVKQSKMSLREVKRYIEEIDANPAYIIRFDEHNELCNSREWKRVCRFAHKRGVPLLAMDYGYFDHYQARYLDRYGPRGESRIRKAWPCIHHTNDWPHALAVYRDKVQDFKTAALREGPLFALQSKDEPGKARPYVCIWLSLHVALARKPFRAKRDVWAFKACEAIRAAGYEPVIKASPASDFTWPDDVLLITGRDPLENARLAVHAANNVIVNSTVSNELVLWGVPVTALGRSWFTGHGVFHEPATWADISAPHKINHSARERWINWWLKEQFYPEQLLDRIESLL